MSSVSYLKVLWYFFVFVVAVWGETYMIFLAICHKVNDISSCFQVPNQCITAINLKYLLHYSLQKHFFFYQTLLVCF
jgi:hypothetical protein